MPRPEDSQGPDVGHFLQGQERAHDEEEQGHEQSLRHNQRVTSFYIFQTLGLIILREGLVQLTAS